MSAGAPPPVPMTKVSPAVPPPTQNSAMYMIELDPDVVGLASLATLAIGLVGALGAVIRTRRVWSCPWETGAPDDGPCAA